MRPRGTSCCLAVLGGHGDELVGFHRGGQLRRVPGRLAVGDRQPAEARCSTRPAARRRSRVADRRDLPQPGRAARRGRAGRTGGRGRDRCRRRRGRVPPSARESGRSAARAWSSTRSSRNVALLGVYDEAPRPPGTRRRAARRRAAGGRAATGATAGSSRRAQGVADAPDGVDQRGPVRVELLAQVADVGLQHAAVAAEVVLPDVVEDLRAREDSARVEQQVAQQAVLGRRELDRRTGAVDLARVLVELDVLEDEALRLGAGSAASGAGSCGCARRAPRG